MFGCSADHAAAATHLLQRCSPEEQHMQQWNISMVTRTSGWVHPEAQGTNLQGVFY